jgi:predicted DNA-binding transcriptional regulator AlpA
MSNTKSVPEFITIKQAAFMAGVTPMTIWRKVRSGEIPAGTAIQLGGPHTSIRLVKDDYVEWLFGEGDEAA